MVTKNNMNAFDVETLNKYYCNKESLREKHHSSYINRIEMDEIMTYAYSSDENDYINQSTNIKDSDDDSLGISSVDLCGNIYHNIRNIYILNLSEWIYMYN